MIAPNRPLQERISTLLIYCVTFIITFLTITTIATLAIIHSYATAIAPERADCIVVFGAAVWEDDKPSHALRDRMIAGTTLYHSNYSKNCLILSGGPSVSGSIHEVDSMVAIAQSAQIPNDAIIRDYNGVNTRATIANLNPAQSYILVSNNFHLARIMFFARKRNLSATAHAAPYVTSGRYRKEYFFTFREVLALWYYALTAHFHR